MIFVDKIDVTQSGRIVSIKGFGAAINQNVVITISDESSVEITELRASTTSTGEFGIPWIVPSDVAPGTYTLKAKDPVTEVEITFVLN